MGGWAQTSANPTMKMDSCIPFCMIFFTIFFRHGRFERNRNFYARNWKLFDDWNLYHTLLQILTPKEGRQTLLILHQLIFIYSKLVKFSIFALLFFTYKCGTTLIYRREILRPQSIGYFYAFLRSRLIQIFLWDLFLSKGI